MAKKSSKPPVRSAGVLLHITSLPSRHGIGDFGPAAYACVDALARAKQTWWQVLPLGPPGDGNSPYQSYSAFAGNPSLVNPDLLRRDGLLTTSDIEAPRFAPRRIDFARAVPHKTAMLRKAWERFQGGAARPLRGAFERFCSKESWWLDDFALFAVLHEVYPGVDWTQWPREIVQRKAPALKSARQEHAQEFRLHQFVQFLFDRQLQALRAYALAHGVHLFGDLPIFVSSHSADVWASQHLFLLDKHHQPKVVAGVPPDHFSATGQRWGNPLYDWSAMRKDGYHWWIRRFGAALRHASLVRIDHFRGFAASWHIPAAEPTAIRGRWVRAPGAEMLKAVEAAFKSLPFVAEDLGVITPDVVALRTELSLPGMRILQFAFGGSADNPYLPHNYDANGVAYTGTHDNDTTVGWYTSLPKPQQAHVREYLGLTGNPRPSDVCRAMIRAVWSSVANRAIVPAQDILALSTESRMNIPGSAAGNWGWRLTEEQLMPRHLDRLAELTELFGRTSSAPARA